MDKIKDIVKKYGTFIELAGYILAITSIFLPFVKVVYLITVKAAYIKYTLGVFVLIFTLISTCIVMINKYAKHVFDNLVSKNKNIQLGIDYLPLALSVLSLLFTIISGTRSTSAISHLTIGFYLLLLGLIIAICVRVIDRFVINKPTTTNNQANN